MSPCNNIASSMQLNTYLIHIMGTAVEVIKAVCHKPYRNVACSYQETFGTREENCIASERGAVLPPKLQGEGGEGRVWRAGGEGDEREEEMRE